MGRPERTPAASVGAAGTLGLGGRPQCLVPTWRARLLRCDGATGRRGRLPPGRAVGMA